MGFYNFCICMFRTSSEKLIAELSESVEKFTKSYKVKNFFSRDFLFLKLEPSILAFAKETTFAVQVLDSQVQGE